MTDCKTTILIRTSDLQGSLELKFTLPYKTLLDIPPAILCKVLELSGPALRELIEERDAQA